MTVSTNSSPAVAPAPSRRPIAGIGRICVWNAGSLWIGRSAGTARPHAHHALQISLALEGEFALAETGSRVAEVQKTAAIVPPHLGHRFDGLGATVAQMFVEPESEVGRRLLARFAHDRIAALDAADARALRSVLHGPLAAGAEDLALIGAAQRALEAFAGAVGAPPIDHRILSVLDWLRSRPDAAPSLTQAAARVHLSPSRFRHLFAAETGTTFRAWLLWLRLGTAVQSAMAGRSWTDAAHAAGFADSSHLSRSFRRTFGVVPVMLVVERKPLALGALPTC